MTVLVCEDSEDDFHFVQHALRESKLDVRIQWVKDGSEAVEYLEGNGLYADRLLHPLPEVLLIDLKMRRMGGLALLEWLRGHPHNQVVPTVMLSSSSARSDVQTAYRLGANTYFQKPVELEKFVQMFRVFGEYWEIAVKPSDVR